MQVQWVKTRADLDELYRKIRRSLVRGEISLKSAKQMYLAGACAYFMHRDEVARMALRRARA